MEQVRRVIGPSLKDLSAEPPSGGRGVAGATGAGDGLRLAAGTGEAAKGILGLTPQQLKNRGITAEQILGLQTLRDAQ